MLFPKVIFFGISNKYFHFFHIFYPPVIFLVFPFHRILWIISMWSILILKALILTRVIRSTQWKSVAKFMKLASSFMFLFMCHMLRNKIISTFLIRSVFAIPCYTTLNILGFYLWLFIIALFFFELCSIKKKIKVKNKILFCLFKVVSFFWKLK